MKTTLTITNTKTKKSITFNKVDLEFAPTYFYLSKSTIKKIAVILKNLNINWSSVTWTTPEHPKTFTKFQSGDPISGYLIINKPELLNLNKFLSDIHFKSLTLDYTLN